MTECKIRDNSVVEMSLLKMVRLCISRDDLVAICAADGYATVAIAHMAWQSELLADNRIRMPLSMRSNIRASLGDVVRVERVQGPLVTCKQIVVSPMGQSDRIKDEGADKKSLVSYFRGRHRPAAKGEVYPIIGPHGTVEFRIDGISPEDRGVVGDETVIRLVPAASDYQGQKLQNEELKEEGAKSAPDKAIDGVAIAAAPSDVPPPTCEVHNEPCRYTCQQCAIPVCKFCAMQHTRNGHTVALTSVLRAQIVSIPRPY